MTCFKCSKPAITYDLTIGKLCKHCFTKQLERRVKRSIRGFWPKKEDVLIVPGNFLEAAVTRHVLTTLLKGFPCSIQKQGKGTPVHITNLETHACIILDNLFTQKELPEHAFAPLHTIPQQDIMLYADIKHIPYEEKLENHHLHKTLQHIEQKYPGTTNSLIKSANILLSK
jgi:hypothetical protein